MLFLFGLLLLIIVYLTQNNIKLNIDFTSSDIERFTNFCNQLPDKLNKYTNWDMEIKESKSYTEQKKTKRCLSNQNDLKGSIKCLNENNINLGNKPDHSLDYGINIFNDDWNIANQFQPIL